MKNNILGTEKMSSLFIKFMIPAVISMVIAGTQTIIDGIFLGNFVGPDAMASVNIVQPFMQILTGCGFIISIGSLSFIGRSLGEGKKEEAQNIFRTSFLVIILISILIMLFGELFNNGIAIALGANEELLSGVKSYIRIISIFSPFIGLMFLFGFVNRVVGRPDLYLKGMILSVCVNVVLDYLLIKEFGLGVKGAAFATGLAYTSALLIVIKPMINKRNTINIFKGKFNKKFIWPVIYNGSAEGVVSLASAITSYVFNMTFMKIAGADGVAAFTTINYIGQFGTLIMFGISDGIVPIVSFNHGYRKSERVNKALNVAIKLNLVVGIILFLTLFIFGKELIVMFAGENKEILKLAVDGSKIYAISFLLCGFNIIKAGYFTAVGNSRAAIIIAASRGIIFILLGMAILPSLIGISGVWLTVPFSEIMTVLISVGLTKLSNRNLALEMVA